MPTNYFITAYITLILSFIFAIGIAGFFKFFKFKDLNIYKKRAAHLQATSRLGGLAVCGAILFAVFLESNSWNLEILISVVPLFIAGLLEDIGRQLKPKLRLAIGVLSAALFIAFKGHIIQDVGVGWANLVLSVTPIAILFTVFCIVALVNALNFIDGVNGLASGKTLLSAFALMWLAIEFNEPNLILLGVSLFSASLGLFLVNYPQGRIFLGDAGAYALGFLLAVSLITIQSKHSEISAWSILLLIFWPISDMTHSILRRQLKRQRSDRPDYLHFHHVVMRSLVILSSGRIAKEWANPLATAIILPLAALPVVLGLIFRENNEISMAVFLGFMLLFACMHAGIVKGTRHRRIFNGKLRK